MENKDLETLLEKVEVKPSNNLKNRIMNKLNEKSFKRKSIFSFRTISISFASVVILFLLIFSLINVYQYNEVYSQIYIDINPSLELKINKYNYVLEIKYLNTDAKDVFVNTEITNLKADVAINNILTTLDNKNYLESGSELYISGYCPKDLRQLDMLFDKTKEYVDKNHHTVGINREELSINDIKNGKEFNMSPMKNRMIDEILGLGGPKDKDYWRNRPMSEIKDELDGLQKNPNHPDMPLPPGMDSGYHEGEIFDPFKSLFEY